MTGDKDMWKCCLCLLNVTPNSSADSQFMLQDELEAIAAMQSEVLLGIECQHILLHNVEI